MSPVCPPESCDLAVGPTPEGTQDDLLMAQMLQLEFDREHDRQLQAEEKHANKQSSGQTCLPLAPHSNSSPGPPL